MDIAETFRKKKASGGKFASLTAYDYTFARLLDDAGLDFLLVGDSVGMVQLGLPDTVGVTMADMIHHTRSVARGTKLTPVFADLPAGSCATPAEALVHARQLVAEGARVVKIEGGREMLPCIEVIVNAGIPVCGHIGMLPQQVRIEGGYKIKGKSDDEAAKLLDDARALDDAGVVAAVLELVTPTLAAEITRAVSYPTIGIGSGDDCDGQILVTYDLLGLCPWFRPRFVRPEAELATPFREAVARYVKRCGA